MFGTQRITWETIAVITPNAKSDLPLPLLLIKKRIFQIIGGNISNYKEYGKRRNIFRRWK
jgi:hypothetical protein